jgi:hypothetical protein
MKPFAEQETHVFANAGHIVFYDAQLQVAEALVAFANANYGRSY